MKKLLFLIFIFSFFSILCSWGQQHFTRNYTINEGLPDNCIRDIYKDSRGFLWIGTDAGLSRFDGKNFQVYTSQDGLIGDKIWSVTESADGNIWIGCHDGGISKLNGTGIISYNTESGLISNEVRTIHYSLKNNILLIGTEDGLSVFNDGKIISFHKKLNNVNKRLQITNFIENDDFIYVFTNGNGLYKYIPELESLIRIPTDHKLNNYQTNSAYISTTKDTLINFNRKSLFYIKKEQKFTSDFIGQIIDYKEDLDNNIWIAAWSNNYKNTGGLFKYDSTGVTDFGKYLGIKSNNILSIEIDLKENLLWIGTKEYGLFLYPMNNFTYFKSEDFKLSELNITDLNLDKSNNLWIATKNEIIKKYDNDNYKIFNFEIFNTKYKHFVENTIKTKYYYLIDQTGSFEKYQHLISSGAYPFSNPYKKLNGIVLQAKSLYKPLKYDILVNKKLKEFNSILIDSVGNKWVGSNVGIFKIDKQTENITYFDLEGNQFNDFSFDSENRLFGVSWADMFIYPDINTNSDHYYYNYYERKSPININKIKCQDNKVWFISSDHGLFLFDEIKFHSTYEHERTNYRYFNDICFDNFGNIIIGGNNGKIYIAEFSNDTIKFKYKIDNRSGLIGTSIRWLNCTKDNILIAGTNAGLNLINIDNLHATGNIYIETIDESKGLKDYSGRCSIIQNDKYLWIGSNTNLIRTDLEKLKEEDVKYINFYIKSIEVNDKPLSLKSFKDTDHWTNIPKSSIKLPYYKNSITFYYDAIKYLDPENINFNYKLEGYHNNWVKETKDRKAVFQNLNPGKYRLRINVLNKNTTSQELSISFVISSPFWLKWWFISLVFGLILFLIWLIIFLRTKAIKKKERLRTEISERISEFEMKALRAQMNPHFIFNAINSIQNYMLDNDIDSALHYLSDFAKLIRLTLDNVSKRRITLDEELNYLKYYLSLEEMRFAKKFEIEIILPPDYDNRKFLIPSMIIQPYVENSIKHGFIYRNEGGKIKLEFQVSKDNILKCIIEDNGIGRKKSRELNKSKKGQSSKGIFITSERLSLLNQTQQRKGYKAKIIDLYDEFNLACGTRVEIFIPI